MEVVIDRDAFLKGLQMVQNIVEPRQTLPILANVLLESDSEAVRVTATDLEVGARVTIPAKVASKGAITVSARKLGEIVKELPAAAVALRVTDNVSVSLRCAGATYKLVGLAPDDFPPVVPASPASWVSLEGKTLREMLAQTSFAISHDETRYALNGILFLLQGKDVQMVDRWPSARRVEAESGPRRWGHDRHRAPQGRHRDHAGVGRGRGCSGCDHGESVRAPDAELRDDCASDRGAISELRGGRPKGAPGPARRLSPGVRGGGATRGGHGRRAE